MRADSAFTGFDFVHACVGMCLCVCRPEADTACLLVHATTMCWRPSRAGNQNPGLFMLVWQVSYWQGPSPTFVKHFPAKQHKLLLGMLTWPLLGLSSPLAGDLGNIPKLGSIHVEHQEGLSPFQVPLTHSMPGRTTRLCPNCPSSTSSECLAANTAEGQPHSTRGLSEYAPWMDKGA